jgi:hypothetical protein
VYSDRPISRPPYPRSCNLVPSQFLTLIKLRRVGPSFILSSARSCRTRCMTLQESRALQQAQLESRQGLSDLPRHSVHLSSSRVLPSQKFPCAPTTPLPHVSEDSLSCRSPSQIIDYLALRYHHTYLALPRN